MQLKMYIFQFKKQETGLQKLNLLFNIICIYQSTYFIS